MPKFHGKCVRVYYDGYDISGDLNKVMTSIEYDTQDTTSFGDPTKNYVVGYSGNADLGFDGFFNNDAARVHQVGTTFLGGSAHVFTAVAGTSPGNAAWAGSAFWQQLDAPLAVGAAAQESAKFVAAGGFGVDAATLIEYVPEATGAGAAVDGVAASASGARGYVNVLNVSSSPATVVIQHSTATGGPWVDLITFTDATGRTSEGKAVTGTVNRYLRRNISAGSANVVVTFKRI